MFEIHELYVVNNLRVCEYTTRYGVRRCDIQPWRGETTLRIPFENSDSTWESKVFPIDLTRASRD